MLDELVDVIETLKSRINEHHKVLQGNEAQTRMSLIDPLLRALGWDTADPTLVRPEYVVRGRRADYALLNAEGDVAVFLEAKNLGEQLARHRSQAHDYARDIGCRYPALTDGNNWEVYDRARYDVPSDQSHILKVSIVDDPPYKCALQFLLLWRPNLASGQPIEAGEPIMGTEPEKSTIVTLAETAMPTAPDAGWVALRDFVATKGSTAPSKIRFPNGNESGIKNWRGLIIQIADWLVEEGALTPEECPVPTDNRPDHHAIHSQPRHPNGHNFYNPYTLSNGLFLSPTVPATSVVSRCRAIIKHCGKDPASVHVQVG